MMMVHSTGSLWLDAEAAHSWLRCCGSRPSSAGWQVGNADLSFDDNNDCEDPSAAVNLVSVWVMRSKGVCGWNQRQCTAFAANLGKDDTCTH
jgi:hypothetical protein